MFLSRYFAPRYFAPRYFPKVGAAAAGGGAWSPDWARRRAGRRLKDAIRERDELQRREMFGDEPASPVERTVVGPPDAALDTTLNDEARREIERQATLARLKSELRAARRVDAAHREANQVRALRQEIELLERQNTATKNRARREDEAFFMLLAA